MPEPDEPPRGCIMILLVMGALEIISAGLAIYGLVLRH